MRSPSVQTKTVLIASAGYNYRKATEHTYAFSEPVSLPDPVRKGHEIVGMGHFFRCKETGELRRYGFDAAFPEGN